MSASTASEAHAWRLDDLFEVLRNAQIPVRAAEAVDAARLVQHLAHRPGGHDLASLRLKLRPIFCKSAADQLRFDTAYADWMGGGLRPGQAGREPLPWLRPSAAAPSPAERRPAGGGSPAVRGGSDRRRWWWLALASLALAAGGAALMVRWQPSDAPASQTVTPGVGPASTATTPGPTPPASATAAGRQGVPQTAPVVQASASDPVPPPRETRVLRMPWLLLLSALPLLVGALNVLRPRQLRYITRRRTEPTLRLEGWPPSKLRRRLVADLGSDIAGRLQRHVRASTEQPGISARRPQVDVQKSVQETLRRGGLPTFQYRFARLRPSYLVLVEVPYPGELGVLWAQRLGELDAMVSIFTFRPAVASEVEPVCQEVGGLQRWRPFHALPAPRQGQRLLLVGRTAVLVGQNGELHPWVKKSGIDRWAQRALFTPDEPRAWDPAHVARLERRRGPDPGMMVLPFEDGALEAWSEWLVRGYMPPVELAEPQLYPSLLARDDARLSADGEARGDAPAPEVSGPYAQQLVTELQGYLGRNGFYWLCACAVPPVIDPRLAQRMGEAYFRQCDVRDERIGHYMARNWRLLSRLPWLREDGPQMPQWLRLTLLARLPEAVQDELRETVRTALGPKRPSAGSPGARDAIALGFDSPDEYVATGEPQVSDMRFALTVAFVRDGLTAQELVLRIPGPWQEWLPGTIASTRKSGPARLGPRARWDAARRRLALTTRLDPAAPLRWAGLGLAVGGLLLYAVLQSLPSTWPAGLAALIFVPADGSSPLRQAVEATDEIAVGLPIVAGLACLVATWRRRPRAGAARGGSLPASGR